MATAPEGPLSREQVVARWDDTLESESCHALGCNCTSPSCRMVVEKMRGGPDLAVLRKSARRMREAHAGGHFQSREGGPTGKNSLDGEFVLNQESVNDAVVADCFEGQNAYTVLEVWRLYRCGWMTFCD
jgi:hypothetical protein